MAKTDLNVAGHAAKLRPSEPDAAAPEGSSAISSAEEIARLKVHEPAKGGTRDQAERQDRRSPGSPDGLGR